MTIVQLPVGTSGDASFLHGGARAPLALPAPLLALPAPGRAPTSASADIVPAPARQIPRDIGTGDIENARHQAVCALSRLLEGGAQRRHDEASPSVVTPTSPTRWWHVCGPWRPGRAPGCELTRRARHRPDVAGPGPSSHTAQRLLLLADALLRVLSDIEARFALSDVIRTNVSNHLRSGMHGGNGSERSRSHMSFG